MNSGRHVTSVPSAVLVALTSVLLICAAQAQQSPYPAPVPGQPYPSYPQTPAAAAQAPAYPQMPAYPAPAQVYPGSAIAPYPGQMPPYQPGAYPPGSAPPQSHFFRDLFAQTIAAVIQTSTGGLLSAITGRIMEWFVRRGAAPAMPGAYPGASPYPQYANSGFAPAPGYPSAGYPSATTPGYPGASAYPQASTYAAAPAAGYPGTAYPSAPTPGYPGAPAYPQTSAYAAAPAPGYPSTAYPSAPTPGYPSTAYPSAPTPGYPSAAYPQAAGQPAAPTPALAYPTTPAATAAYPASAPQVYDARTGQLQTGAANPYATRGVGMEGQLYAGIAYEVHILGADGTYSDPVNTATYEFHTGDKFMVYYRPSTPGHMEIYNVNASSVQSLIDSSNMAAGQMVGLGPYQFTNATGDESLRLVLSPCSSPQLLTATRDIVKADALPQPAQPGPGLSLGSCGTPTARGVDVHTRDIEKVGVEGTTSFALDPISAKELKSGQITPRQATVVFHHR